MKGRVLAIGQAISADAISTLEADGFEVKVAPDYPQGLKRLDETLPDLVILDETLPTINGWEACSRLRQVSDVPIILLGADQSGQAVARAIEQGADTYMFKPAHTYELKARVNALLRRYKGKEAVVTAGVEKEQGPILDLVDKITSKETALHVDMEDVGGRLFGRSLRLMGRVNISLGTLKSPTSYS